MQPTKVLFTTQSTALLVANVFGAILYVFAASRGGWAIPQERAAGIYTTTGEPFIWFLNIMPIIAFFLGMNLIWGLRIFINKSWHAGWVWLMAAAVWFLAAIIDFVHH